MKKRHLVPLSCTSNMFSRNYKVFIFIFWIFKTAFLYSYWDCPGKTLLDQADLKQRSASWDSRRVPPPPDKSMSYFSQCISFLFRLPRVTSLVQWLTYHTKWKSKSRIFSCVLFWYFKQNILFHLWNIYI